MFGEEPLSSELIRRLLDQAWSLSVDAVDYAAVGYGSYHWRTSGRDSWFVTADRVRPQSVAAEEYRVARRLSDDGLEFVRAPVRHRDDDVVWEVDGWWVTVWPWLGGRTAPGLEHASVADAEATVRCIRRLHDQVSVSPIERLVENWSIPLRSELVDLLGCGPAGNGPYTELRELRRSLKAAGS